MYFYNNQFQSLRVKSHYFYLTRERAISVALGSILPFLRPEYRAYSAVIDLHNDRSIHRFSVYSVRFSRSTPKPIDSFNYGSWHRIEPDCIFNYNESFFGFLDDIENRLDFLRDMAELKNKSLLDVI